MKRKYIATFIFPVHLVTVELPAPGVEDYFKISYDGKNITIMIPEVETDKEGVKKHDVYRKLVNRKYAVKISHQYDEINIPFEITGENVQSHGEAIF